MSTGDMVALKSLTPRYDEGQHKTYLDHLEKAVQEPKNRNIAVSGRYGTGKSSVLNQFEENHKDATLRLALPSLAPDTEGVGFTNRIQREVLKQLIYSAQTRTLRHSRFSRPVPLPWRQAIAESGAFVFALGVALALFGYFPTPVVADADLAIVQVGGWLLFWLLPTALLAVVRMVTYNRFIVAGVSAAGNTLSLSESTNTYFDEHLDEIVYFFDQEHKDIVIFEDLDRYDNAYIFQALHELNTLLNNTPRRLKKIEKKGTPLRFVYAMRDSLFEQIGTETVDGSGDTADESRDTTDESGDVARAETVRANRTKFFDVVIPVVPFISHRTAREHLHQLLAEAGVTDIERPLVEIVAQHATDMRLLLNIRNEYLVFAERLLNSDKVAPELSSSHLFALVAYKNFHLADFENIARRSSDLDRLYDYHRALVARAIAHRQQQRRDLLAKNTQPSSIGPFAKQLGERLIAIGQSDRDRDRNANANMRNGHLSFLVNSTSYNPDAVITPAFWDEVVATAAITPQIAPNPRPGGWSQRPPLTQEHLECLFPEALKGRWKERNDEAVDAELQQLDREIDELRSVDFRGLVEADKFMLSVPAPAGGSEETEEWTFGELVQRTLKSDLACELVRQGYIDRNFTLYTAQFYGDFTGVDVATFIVQTVQTNNMDIHYPFTSPGACANLLAEIDTDFTRTISAYNVQLVNYLLTEDTARADEVVKHLTSNFGSDAEQFLAAFFTSPGHRTQLAARLSRESWRDVFTYLVSSEGVPNDMRTTLVDAALVAADPNSNYDLRSDVGDFVVSHYEEMPAFTEPHSEPELDTIVALLRRAGVFLPNLEGVHEDLRTLIVANNLYQLTANNLRSALDITGEVTLDRLRDNDTVYQYCLANLDIYLATVDTDGATAYSVRTPQTLVDALETAEGDDTTLARLTASASPESSLQQLGDAPQSTWQALAAATLFRSSLANLEAYRAEVGSIDTNLGQLLIETGVIHTDDGDTDGVGEADEAAAANQDDTTETPDKGSAAIAVLNARRGIPRPEDRIQLVSSLDLDESLPPDQITPDGALFALLITHELVPDEPATFTHLRAAGWDAVRPAIIASHHIGSFLTPDLVEGMVADLFGDPETSNKVGNHMLESLSEYLPTDDSEALTAAAEFAVRTGTALPLDQIRRVATACGNAALTIQLLQLADPTADDIATVLNELGGPYSYLTSWEKDQFEVPNDDAHKAVFKTLKNANLCTTTTRPRKSSLIVKRPQPSDAS